MCYWPEINVVYSYTRPPPRNKIFTPHDDDDDPASCPQQKLGRRNNNYNRMFKQPKRLDNQSE
ncbi:hypothetical protein Lal_00026782 [Lupinus albus]|nr:hypothetical protein Lal_00026782 [Lupinus albus]